MNYVIGDTPLIHDIAQSHRGDFVWVLPFVDVADDGTETDTDLTDCEFVFGVLELDGTTEKLTLTNGDGISIADNIVHVTIAKEVLETWTRGCKYPYFFTYTNAGGHTKCLFEAKFILT